MNDVVVIGIGNRFRCDDGAGPSVLDLLTSRPAAARARLVELDGEPARIIDAWTGVDVAIVVDAIRCEPPQPGSIHRVQVDDGTELRDGHSGSAGSHALGVGCAAALGRALGRMPKRLVVFGIEGAAWDHGEALSPSVDAAVAEVVQRVATEIETSV